MIVCNLAFMGIAATLLPNGRTLHNRFGLPVPLYSNSVSTIKSSNLQQRHELRRTDIFIIDEISCVPKHAIGIIDKLLQDIRFINFHGKLILNIRGNKLPFGGTTILLGGDFQQILSVQRHATKSQLIDLCVKKHEHWPKFKKFRFIIFCINK